MTYMAPKLQHVALECFKLFHLVIYMEQLRKQVPLRLTIPQERTRLACKGETDEQQKPL